MTLLFLLLYALPLGIASCSGEEPSIFKDRYAAGEDETGTDSSNGTGFEDNNCQDGDTQTGESPCGVNQRGVFKQECTNGKWEDSTDCLDDDICQDEDTQLGTTKCGDDNQGRLEQECADGQWENSKKCVTSAECNEDDTRDRGSCELASGDTDGTMHQVCVDGFWEDDQCLAPGECVEGSVRTTNNTCGTGTPKRGYYLEECKSSRWRQTECYDMNLDIGGPCRCEGDDCFTRINIPLIMDMRMKNFFKAPADGVTDLEILGCDYVKEKYGDWPYTQVGCMRSQKGGYNPQYWPNGYCMILSFGCSGNNNFCNVIPSAGNFKNHTECPPGLVMLEEQFRINQFNFTLKNKYCLQGCTKDSECRTKEADPIFEVDAPLYKCFKETTEDGETIGYCWDDRNEVSDDHRVTQF